MCPGCFLDGETLGVNCVPLSSFSPGGEKSPELVAAPEWKHHCVEQEKVDVSQKCQGTGQWGKVETAGQGDRMVL